MKSNGRELMRAFYNRLSIFTDEIPNSDFCYEMNYTGWCMYQLMCVYVSSVCSGVILSLPAPQISDFFKSDLPDYNSANFSDIIEANILCDCYGWSFFYLESSELDNFIINDAADEDVFNEMHATSFYQPAASIIIMYNKSLGIFLNHHSADICDYIYDILDSPAFGFSCGDSVFDDRNYILTQQGVYYSALFWDDEVSGVLSFSMATYYGMKLIDDYMAEVLASEKEVL